MVPGEKANGWTYAAQKNEERRTHPDLVAWEDLPEGEREKNLATVRQLPALLSRIGFEISRIDPAQEESSPTPA